MLRIFPFVLSVLSFPASADVLLRECRLIEHCEIGVGCKSIDKAFSWLEIDDARLEVKRGDNFVATSVESSTNVRWSENNSMYRMQFMSPWQFLITEVITEAPQTALQIETDEEKVMREWNELLGKSRVNLQHVSISVGECDK